MYTQGIQFFKETLFYFSLVLTVKAASLSCSISANNAQVFYPQGSFTVTFTPQIIFDTASLSIPLQWSSSLDNNKPILTANTQCSIFNQNIPSNVNICVMSSSSSSSIMSCTNPTINQLSSYSISCINIQNPSSTEPTGLISLTTSKQKAQLETSTSNLIISNWIPNQIVTANFDIRTNAQVEISPNLAGQATIKFNTVSEFYGTDQVQVQIQSSSGLYFPKNFLVTMQISSSTVTQQAVSSSSTTVTLQQTYNNNIQAGAQFQIQINMIEGPSCQINSLTIQTLRIKPSGSYLIDQYQNLNFQPIPGTLVLISVQIDNTVISQSAQYSFQIQLNNPLLQSGYVTLLLPPGLSTLNNSIQCSMQINQNTPQTGLCTVVGSQQGLIIYAKNLFNVIVNVNSILILQISGIINAQYTDTLLQFNTIQSFYSSSLPSLVDQLYQPFQFNPQYTPGSISNVSISSQSDFVGSNTGLIIGFTLNDKLNQNGYLIFSIPSDLQFQGGQPLCQIGSLSCQVNFITGQNNMVKISNFTNDVPSQAQQIIIISNLIINPLSTRPTQQFSLQSYQYNNVIIDQNLNIPGYTVFTPSYFTQVVIDQGSKINGAITFYTFTITLSTSFINNSILIINLPGQVISNGNICTLNQLAQQTILPCQTTNLTQIIVSLNNLTIPNLLFKINIQNIQNHFSFARSYPFLQLNDSIYAISNSSKNNLVIQNNIPGQIQNAYISLQNGIYGSNDTYTFNFTTQNVVDITCSFQIQVPQQITILKNNMLCAGGKFVGFTTSPDCYAIGQKITITPNSLTPAQNNYFLFQITQLQNPTQLNSDAFTISTFDNYTNLMDNQTSNQLIFQPLCQLPCKTCAQANQTQCFSCYTNLQNITNKIYFNPSNNLCVVDCGSSYYSKQNICYNCGQNCLSCQNDNICILCVPGFLLQGGKCVNTCFANQFNNLGVCSNCSENCLTCDGSAGNCLSCNTALQIPLFLLGKNCTDTCQYGYFGSILNGKCSQCDVTCQTCLTLKQCLTCIQGVPRYYSNYQCLNCSQGCQECTKSDDCSKCSSSYFLLGSKCYINCPLGYTKNQLTNKCDLQESSTIVQYNITPSKYIPVPFLILFFVAGLTVIVSKLHRHETFVPGAMLGLCSCLEWGSWITLIYLYNNEANMRIIYIIPVYLGLATSYLINMINLICIRTKMYRDPEFDKWLNSAITHKITVIIAYTLSMLTTFKASRMIYSKYFAFSFFKAKLSDTQPFFIFNLINGISILITTIPTAVGSALIAYHSNQQNQLFISAIDAFIVTLLMMVFQLWETKKDENFFDETSAQFYYSLNATKIEVGQDSGFFHKAFDKQKDIVQAENDQDVHQVNKKNEQDVRAENNEDNSSSSKQKLVIHSDRQSQGIQDSAQGEKYDEVNVMYGSQVKSNSKHTIYFGQNASYKLSNVQPYELKQETSKQGSIMMNQNLSNRYSNISMQEKAPGSPQKTSQMTQRILEHQSEIDYDDEPIQPSPQKIFIDTSKDNSMVNDKDILNSEIPSGSKQQTKMNLKKGQDVIPNQSNQINDEQLIFLEPIQPVQDLHQFSSLPNYQSSGQKNNSNYYDTNDPNEADDSRLSIFEDESKQIVQNNYQDKVKQKHSFDSSSLAAKTLTQGIVGYDDKPEIPLTEFSYQDQDSYKDQSLILQKSVNNKQVEQLEMQVENVDHQIIFQKVNKQKTEDVKSRGSSKKKNNIQIANKLIKSQDVKGYDNLTKNKQQMNVQPRQLRSLNAKEEQGNNRKTNNKSLSPPLSNRFPLNVQNDKIKQVKKQYIQIFDSNESIHTLSDANWGENQISPSDFNALNQRYDDIQPGVDPKLTQSIQQKKTSTTVRSNDRNQIQDRNQQYDPNRAKSVQKKGQQSPPNFSGDDYDMQIPPGPFRTSSPTRGYNNNTLYQIDDISFKQIEQGRLRDIEKIYLQRLENNMPGRQGAKKKPESKHRQKDISDALYIDEGMDENDIIF